MKSLLTVEQLAVILNKSPSSIRCDASRKPQSLPPICRLPGTNRLLWRVEDVEDWTAQHVQNIGHRTVPSRPVPSGLHRQLPQPKKRGRPTKSEQLARQTNGLDPKTQSYERM
jgi:hypothetical protein